jgi:isopenicillin N synthase-like dioxygenase
MVEVPEIDVGRVDEEGRVGGDVAHAVDRACRDVGVFYLRGHGVDSALQDQLDSLAREFFALPDSEKQDIAMAKGGRAWRGWFPVGGELTDGVADMKEGLYFGADLDADHPRVAASTALHGPNLYPRRPAALAPVVDAYMDALVRVGHRVLSAVAVGLGLGPSWFSEHLTTDPVTLFRIFRYPARPGAGQWGVAEHTDYGLLTLLAQDSSGGLQVQTNDGWIDVAPRPGTLVCNLGDMLERLTGGQYRSTAHRVRNTSDHDRLSFPFFLDPSWDAHVERLPIVDRPVEDDAARRWDHASVHGFEGTYGTYLLSKVGQVFPELAASTISIDDDGHGRRREHHDTQ